MPGSSSLVFNLSVALDPLCSLPAYIPACLLYPLPWPAGPCVDRMWFLLPLTGLLSSHNFCHMLWSSCSGLLALPHMLWTCPAFSVLLFLPTLSNALPRYPHSWLFLILCSDAAFSMNQSSWVLPLPIPCFIFSLQQKSSLERLPVLCISMSCLTNDVSEGLSLVAKTLKNLPAARETQVRSLGWEDPLEEGMATHSSILAWRIPMDRGAWRAAVHGFAKSRTRLSKSHGHTQKLHEGRS